MIYINDKEYPYGGTRTLIELLGSLGLAAGKGVAIAVNSNVIPRSEWDSCAVKDNDRIILIKATQGG